MALSKVAGCSCMAGVTAAGLTAGKTPKPCTSTAGRDTVGPAGGGAVFSVQDSVRNMQASRRLKRYLV